MDDILPQCDQFVANLGQNLEAWTTSLFNPPPEVRLGLQRNNSQLLKPLSKEEPNNEASESTNAATAERSGGTSVQATSGAGNARRYSLDLA